ncbi:hypothetical protein GB928_019905 [Shinella curvata]|uniref:Uncharacterized protein n=1 Tax=Shinella curvata TaxID=1817964 RepID=A0ABT8XI95_9HYPH|nr:hypothetical protein [Shinella curvata]MCJ8055937.1 hypothetical protein [Shinella curvata]MDO6123462.1 hypothetical protein [Shinella curvata]
METELEMEIRRLGNEGEKVAPDDADIADLALRLHARFPQYAKTEVIAALESEWRRRGLTWKAA